MREQTLRFCARLSPTTTKRLCAGGDKKWPHAVFISQTLPAARHWQRRERCAAGLGCAFVAFFFCPIRYATWCLRASYEKVVPIGDIQASYSGSVFVCVNMLFGTINHNPTGSPHRRQHTLAVCVCVRVSCNPQIMRSASVCCVHYCSSVDVGQSLPFCSFSFAQTINLSNYWIMLSVLRKGQAVWQVRWGMVQ